MKTSRALAALSTLVVAAAVGADSLYVAKSKDHGTPFELMLIEVKRDSSKSIVQVPKFHSRSAAGSRWLMCMYNDLAAKRGFKYWTVIYPEEPTETFPIALYQEPHANLSSILGADYVAERAFPPQPMPVGKWNEKLCAWVK